MLFGFIKSNLFFKNKVISGNLVLSILLNFIITCWLYLKIIPQVEPIALRYTIYFGIDLIGPWWHVFIFPLIGLIIIIINFILAYLVFLKVKILAYFLVLTSTIVQILFTIMAILIVLLNK